MCACTHRYLYIQKEKKKQTGCNGGESVSRNIVPPSVATKIFPIFINTNVRFPFFNENIEGKKSPTYKVIFHRETVYLYTWYADWTRCVFSCYCKTAPSATKKEQRLKKYFATVHGYVIHGQIEKG